MRKRNVILIVVLVLVLAGGGWILRQANEPADAPPPTQPVSNGNGLIIRVPTDKLQSVERQYTADSWKIADDGNTQDATKRSATEGATDLMLENLEWQPGSPVTLQLSLTNSEGEILYSTQLGAPAPADASQDFLLYWSPESI